MTFEMNLSGYSLGILLMLIGKGEGKVGQGIRVGLLCKRSPWEIVKITGENKNPALAKWLLSM